MECTKCHLAMRLNLNSQYFECGGCGRTRKHSSSDVDTGPQKPLASVVIPQVKKKYDVTPEGKRRGKSRSPMFSFGTRSDYLIRFKLQEVEIMIDDSGREYWIKDNYSSGKTEHVLVPTRFKKKKGGSNFYQ